MINKKFYERYLSEESHQHPVEVLGELYFAEQQNELCDLSYLRFAQGELYYHLKDYETAIFKWENINNDFEEWARKNMADAYFALDLLPNAEEIYLSIKTNQEILSIEISLKLFSLYWMQGKSNQAKEIIKHIVLNNPDYGDATHLARSFFHEQEDWNESIELAVNEANRTHSMDWFDLIREFIELGYTKQLHPSYFINTLKTLYDLSHEGFEELLNLLWKSYKNETFVLEWILEMDSFISSVEIEDGRLWRSTHELYEEIYLELTNGYYLLEEIRKCLPNLLTNWLRVADSSKLSVAAAATLAWKDIMPSSFSANLIEFAREEVHRSLPSKYASNYITDLFLTITKWTNKQNLTNGHTLNQLAGGLLDLSKIHLLLLGTSERGKISVRDSILGRTILEGPSSCVMIFSYDEIEEAVDVSTQDQKVISNLSKFHYVSAVNQEKNDHALLDVRVPSEILKDYQLTVIDLPCITGSSHALDLNVDYLTYTDCVLFILNIHSPFTEKERDILLAIHEKVPNLPVTFLVTEIEEGYSEQEIQRVIKMIKSKLNSYFPDANVIPFQSNNEENLNELLKMTIGKSTSGDLERERALKIHQNSKELLNSLITTRSGLEISLNESISFNKEMTSKLKGAINQLEDTQREKVNKITERYSEVKNLIKEELSKNLPKILRSCSDLVDEKSNLNQIHRELDSEMNRRIEEYLKSTIEPLFVASIHDWITKASDEFNQSKKSLEELCDSLNGMYGVNKINLHCDFKVLEDWKRDAERMLNRIHVDKIDIFLKFTPAQFLLKSAGLILGSLPQKTMISTKYKGYIENRSYDDVVNLVTTQFLTQFDFFEKAIERDVIMFFVNPFKTLKHVVEETIKETEEKREILREMNSRPEIFEDALTIFEIRLNQYEWMNSEVQSINM